MVRLLMTNPKEDDNNVFYDSSVELIQCLCRKLQDRQLINFVIQDKTNRWEKTRT